MNASFFILIVYSVCVAICALGAWLYFKRADDYEARSDLLEDKGVAAEAEITAKRTGGTGRGGYTRYITCQILSPVPGGRARPHPTEIAIVRDDYKNLKIGAHIQVVYLPDTPNILRITSGARAVETAKGNRLIAYTAIGCIVFLIIAALIQLNGLPSY